MGYIFPEKKKLTKFRISSHKLQIEKGRYSNVPVEQRICKMCKQDVEDEIHFLLESPSLAESRRETLNKIESQFPNLKMLNNKNIFSR